MSYNFTIPARGDIGRAIEQVHVKIKNFSVFLEDKTISVEVTRINRQTFESSNLNFTLQEGAFDEIVTKISANGLTLLDAVEISVWEHLTTNFGNDITFNRKIPINQAGNAQENSPNWQQV